jgi:hypothetical protein
MEGWIIESEIAVNIHTGETKRIDVYNGVYERKLDPDWKLVNELSRLEIIKLWRLDHTSENNIVC